MKKWLRKHNIWIIMLIDAFVLAASVFGAALLRFDFNFRLFLSDFKNAFLIYITVKILVAWAFYLNTHLYRYVWRYIGGREIPNIGLVAFSAWIINVVLSLLFSYELPRSVILMDMLFSVMGCVVIRYSYRVLWTMVDHYRSHHDTNATRIMVVGAGAAGQLLANEYKTNHDMHAKLCCFIDDNEAKHGKYMDGIPIVGGVDDIPSAVVRFQIGLIILAIPSVSGLRRKEILEICKQTTCEIKTVPGIYQLLNGEVSVNSLRSVEIEDLLGREPIRVDVNSIAGYVCDRVVMVTGGGGSIGSELCRQIAACRPRQLIILDIYENNAYDIQLELQEKYPDLNLVVLIASVRDEARLEKIYETYHPDLVYHAAAHKHVPLMEDSPNEAIKNNVFGTYNTARLAMKYGVDRFVLISTDKAVNPTNIMGASKRLCEMVIQSLAGKSDTRFATVRFGNVLGSNGSVIPLFRKQIAAGGPVTVTHPDIIRYFMTIPEAVSLVLQAGAYASTESHIFVLDMGTPVKIDDLARNMIRLSGLEPDKDIEIRYTGLRPGEKLYEELLMQEEGLRKTENDLIFIGAPIEIDMERFECDLDRLVKASLKNAPNIFELIEEIVPTYHHDKITQQGDLNHAN